MPLCSWLGQWTLWSGEQHTAHDSMLPCNQQQRQQRFLLSGSTFSISSEHHNSVHVCLQAATSPCEVLAAPLQLRGTGRQHIVAAMARDASISSAAAPRRIILWFRNDLRLRDNVIVHQAVQKVKAQEYDEVRRGSCRLLSQATTVQHNGWLLYVWLRLLYAWLRFESSNMCRRFCMLHALNGQQS